MDIIENPGGGSMLAAADYYLIKFRRMWLAGVAGGKVVKTKVLDEAKRFKTEKQATAYARRWLADAQYRVAPMKDGLVVNGPSKFEFVPSTMRDDQAEEPESLAVAGASEAPAEALADEPVERVRKKRASRLANERAFAKLSPSDQAEVLSWAEYSNDDWAQTFVDELTDGSYDEYIFSIVNAALVRLEGYLHHYTDPRYGGWRVEAPDDESREVLSKVNRLTFAASQWCKLYGLPNPDLASYPGDAAQAVRIIDDCTKEFAVNGLPDLINPYFTGNYLPEPVKQAIRDRRNRIAHSDDGAVEPSAGEKKPATRVKKANRVPNQNRRQKPGGGAASDGAQSTMASNTPTKKADTKKQPANKAATKSQPAITATPKPRSARPRDITKR